MMEHCVPASENLSMAEELLRHPCKGFKEIRSERNSTFARVAVTIRVFITKRGSRAIAEAAARQSRS